MRVVKGLIAQVLIVREFTGSLVSALQNSMSQSAKLNPASGEMFLACSQSPIPTRFGPKKLDYRRRCVRYLACAPTQVSGRMEIQKRMEDASYTLD